jgi:hypothetical protein
VPLLKKYLTADGKLTEVPPTNKPAVSWKVSKKISMANIRRREEKGSEVCAK